MSHNPLDDYAEPAVAARLAAPAVSPTTVAGVPAHAAAGLSAAAIDCRGARVLLAEDNQVNQVIARAMLERAGCRVTLAVNGRIAVEQCLGQSFALVLMDCRMPELDGFEATRKIRAGEAAATARMPIVALTAADQEGDRERCLASGMDDYLSKPFTRADLTLVLQRWIDLAPRPRAAAAPLLEAGSAALAPDAAQIARTTEGQSGATGAPAAFDPAAFQKSLPAGMGVDSPLARKVMRLFVGESAKLLAGIERAGAAVDTNAMFRAAHSLKSSGASVGASEFAALAKGLEAMARAGQSGALAGHPARLRLAYERFCAEPAICRMLAPDAAERAPA